MFTTATLISVATWVATNLLPVLFASYLKHVSDRETAIQNRSDQIDLGQARVASKVNKETADAQTRAAKAVVDAGDVDQLLADLNSGKF